MSGNWLEAPAEEPVTLASYATEVWRTEVYLEHAAIGSPLPAMPLFLRPDRYVSVLLDATYQTAWRVLASRARRRSRVKLRTYSGSTSKDTQSTHPPALL